ncbi:MAG: universal stress protein [Rhodomicrobiaceae bacterium]
MYKNILIATDGTELSEKAIKHGVGLAGAVNGEVTIVTVTEPWDAVIVGEVAMVVPPEKYDETAEANARSILSKAKDIADRAGVTVYTMHMKDRHAADGIIEAATERGADLIVMASHGRRGLSRLVLGSEANEVVTHSQVPVLIIR